eukprot:m51a1_g7364 hypothetical protein (341) ;mRNA; r:53663-57662
MGDAERASLAALFAEADADGDGLLTEEQVRGVLRERLFLDPTAAALRRALDSACPELQPGEGLNSRDFVALVKWLRQCVAYAQKQMITVAKGSQVVVLSREALVHLAGEQGLDCLRQLSRGLPPDYSALARMFFRANHKRPPPDESEQTSKRAKTDDGWKWAEELEQLQRALFESQRDANNELLKSLAAQTEVLDRHIAGRFTRERVTGDGNCQFAAVSRAMAAARVVPSDPMSLRLDAALWLKLHESGSADGIDMGQYYADAGVPYSRFCEEMMKDGMWGNHLTLVALSEHYGLRITVISSSQRGIHEHTIVPQSRPLPVAHVFVAHIAEWHYDALLPI